MNDSRPGHFIKFLTTKNVIEITRKSVMGRKGCEIVLEDKILSTRHCELNLKGEFLTIKDLDSTNGTFVNNTRVEGEPMALRDGDEIRIGSTEFVYFDHRPDEKADFDEMTILEQMKESFAVSRARWVAYVLYLMLGVFFFFSWREKVELAPENLFLHPLLDHPSIALTTLVRVCLIVFPLILHAYVCRRWFNAEHYPKASKQIKIGSFVGVCLVMMCSIAFGQFLFYANNVHVEAFQRNRHEFTTKDPESVKKFTVTLFATSFKNLATHQEIKEELRTLVQQDVTNFLIKLKSRNTELEGQVRKDFGSQGFSVGIANPPSSNSSPEANQGP